MGYRFNDNPPKPENMLHRFSVRNGAKMHLTFACNYARIGHDSRVHDHVGWPRPGYPDDICQAVPPHPVPPTSHRTLDLIPIKLLEEGYTEAYITYEDDDIAEYLDSEASISTDTGSPNLVRMSVHANLPNFSDKPKEVHFTLFVKTQDESHVDAVCHGIIVVLPGNPSPNDQGE